MRMKLFEIRDRATLIPVLAIEMLGENEIERSYLRRSGFSEGFKPMVTIVRLEDGRAERDPFSWGGSIRMRPAHIHIEKEFDHLASGSVVDVRVLLGEADIAAPSEIQVLKS